MTSERAGLDGQSGYIEGMDASGQRQLVGSADVLRAGLERARYDANDDRRCA